MRRLLLLAAVAAAGLGTTVPASAQYHCVGYGSSTGTGAGVCAGTWCGDECFPVVFTYCDGVASAKYCGALNGLGATPPGWEG